MFLHYLTQKNETRHWRAETEGHWLGYYSVWPALNTVCLNSTPNLMRKKHLTRYIRPKWPLTYAHNTKKTYKTRSALGRAHVPPTKVFRRLSRVDCSNAVFAVSRRYITDISMKIRNAQQVFCWPRRLLSVSMYFGRHLHRLLACKLPFVSKRGSN